MGKNSTKDRRTIKAQHTEDQNQLANAIVMICLTMSTFNNRPNISNQNIFNTMKQDGFVLIILYLGRRVHFFFGYRMWANSIFGRNIDGRGKEHVDDWVLFLWMDTKNDYITATKIMVCCMCFVEWNVKRLCIYFNPSRLWHDFFFSFFLLRGS